MTFSKKIISAAVLMATSTLAIAATDTTEIEINVTKDAFVNFIGTLSGNVTRDLAEADVDGATTVLGTLGTESNTVGSCNIDVASNNDFRLQHDVDAALYLHGADNYTVNYGGSTFTDGANGTLTLASCNNAASNMSITSPAISGVVQAGTYSDTLTITVTTQ